MLYPISGLRMIANSMCIVAWTIAEVVEKSINTYISISTMIPLRIQYSVLIHKNFKKILKRIFLFDHSNNLLITPISDEPQLQILTIKTKYLASSFFQRLVIKDF
jgi:hypothetical protein